MKSYSDFPQTNEAVSSDASLLIAKESQDEEAAKSTSSLSISNVIFSLTRTSLGIEGAATLD